MSRAKNISLKIILLILSLLFIPQLSCNSPTDPNDNIQPGRRDYVWTVDTLSAQNNTYYRMWASSPTDVWCTSPGDWDKSIAHFDGESWALYGVSGMNVPHSIFGFSKNDIYIGTAGGEIWRFDGNIWILFAQLTKNGHNDIVFDNIWGESSINFFVFGAQPDSNGVPNNSVIAHYINNKWTMLSTAGLTGIVEQLYLNKSDNRIYLQVINMGNGVYYDSTLIYEYNQGKFKQLYSSIWTQGLQADICLINREVYFILGDRIAIHRNNQFQTVINVDNPNFYQRIWGRNSKDIFLLMTDGLAHYNGSDIQYLFYFNKLRTQIFGAALFESEVFFLVSEPGLNLIYHGKIN